MEALFEILEAGSAERCLALSHKPSGLRAFLVLDDLTLGPAAGGIRTRAYPTAQEGLHDALQLARAMTIKCALAGLAAGGGKVVVLADYLRDRPGAFAKLGEIVQSLGGIFRTAGDLGTTAADLAAVARNTEYAHTNEPELCSAVAAGVEWAITAILAVRGRTSLSDLRVAVQGCGSIGAAVAGRLTQAGARVLVADIDGERANALAAEIDAEVITADAVLTAEVDIISPCATGGVLNTTVAREIKAWAVCGAANNVLVDTEAERVLVDRGILYVPDVIASAGAVIEGIGLTVMNLPDRSPLIARLEETTRTVLEEARSTGLLPTEVAHRLARRRIDAARG